MHTKFCLENMMGTDHLEDLGRDKRIILKWILKKQDFRVWNGIIWLKAGSSGGVL
jgi:hypothetical protein